jgi:hypothetical protein
MKHLQKTVDLCKAKVGSFTTAVKAYKFPNISRFITEVSFLRSIFSGKIFIVNFLCGFLIMGIAIVGWDTKETMGILNKVRGEREYTKKEYTYWKSIVQKYPDYRDGYLKLSTVATKLGETHEAEYYMKKVYELDPNYLGEQP